MRIAGTCDPSHWEHKLRLVKRNPPAKPVTVTSLARQLDLSVCTVSKILNRSFKGASYSASTIRRVEQAARSQGYTPNIHARSLRTRRSMTIGLVLPSGIPYFSGPLTESLESHLRRGGYDTIVGHSADNIEQERRLISAMMARIVDGLLWLPHGSRLRPGDLAFRDNFALVLLDRPGLSDRFPTVLTDNEQASRQLAERVRSAGHRRVVMLSAPGDDGSLLEREAGVRSVFGPAARRVQAQNSVAAARAAVEKCLSDLRDGAALLCLTQNLALGAIEALLRHRLRLGADVGFASFDSPPFCEIWHPGLTRIEQDLDLMAAEAVRLLLQKIANPQAHQPLSVRIPGRLVWGETVVERPERAVTSAKRGSRGKT
jgi:LacI family transcriptional regulator